MTNLRHNLNRLNQRGGATLLTAVILLVVSTMIVIFAANMGKSYDKLVANQSRHQQAFEAAEAGLEFGISYLGKNESTIIASPVSGYINFSNGSTTNVALANGSSFSVVYTNPVANNYDLLLLTSTGINADGTATQVIRQEIKAKAILGNYPDSPLVGKGTVALGGSAVVTNTSNDQTVQAGSAVTINGSAQTVIDSGVSSDASATGSDVVQNQSALAGMSEDDFFATYFGTTSTSMVESQFAYTYSSSTNTNRSSTLNGMTGTSIWINQTSGSTTTINGNTTIGSTENPVLIVVNGNLSISGNVTIYGFTYIMGSSGIDTLTGNINIIGGLVTTGNLNVSGNAGLTYDTTVLDNLQNNESLRYYAKVPGSWKDF